MVLAVYFLLSLILVLTTVFRARQKEVSLTLSLLIVQMFLWHSSVYVANSWEDYTLLATRVAFFFAISSLYTVFSLVRILGQTKSIFSWPIFISYLLSVSIAVSPFNISSAELVAGDSIKVVRETGYSLLVVWIIAITLIIFSRLWGLYKSSSSVLKSQIKVIFVGLLFGISASIFTNVLLPNLSDVGAAKSLSPTGALLFEVLLVYAIVRHKFLDVRLVAARTVAYVLLLATFAATFFLVGSISSALLLSEQLNTYQTIYYAFVSILLAVIFQPLKNYFDYITDQFFFRHHYDTQERLNVLSTVMVSEYVLDKLAPKSLKVVAETLKIDRAQLILVDENGEFYEEYSVGDALIHDPDDLFSQSSIGDAVMLHDYDHLDRLPKKFIKLLERNNIAAVYRLQSSNSFVGYLVIANKLNGSILRNQDEQFMSIAVNELSVAILNARRFAEINSFNETLKLEIDRATAQLKRSNTKLLELDEAKDEFITMASHQLRTPLTSVKGYLSMVIEGDVGKISDEQKDLLNNAYVSAQRMVYLIADLLNVSRLKTGKFIIEKSDVDLPQLVEDEITQLHETAKQRKLKIEFKKPKRFPEVYLDENKIRQVVMNFIDNAIYYTPNDGKIKIKLVNTKDNIEFRVEDNGIGVPKAEQHKLFNKFYRANNARKARPDGTGLGLFMAQKVIIAQGGSIIFESKENKGSTFGFSFPKKRVLKD